MQSTPRRYCEGKNERLQIGRNYLEGKKEGKGLGEKMTLVTIWWEADKNSSVSVFEAQCKKEEERMGTRIRQIRSASAAFNLFF